MSTPRAALVQLNLAVLLFGVAGLLGKMTTLSPLMIVLGRTSFGSLAFFILWRCGFIALPAPRQRWEYLGLLAAGLLLGLHWISFFQSIQDSSVAVGLLSFSSFPIFVTLFEPMAFHEPRRPVDGLTAALVLAGLVLLVPRFDWGERVTQGVAWGVLSGLCFAGLVLMNRKLSRTVSPLTIAAAQNGVAATGLLLLLPAYAQPVAAADLLLLFVLGVVFTALAHALFIRSLVHVRAQLASIISALEAVYGGMLAWLLLGELPTPRTVCGGCLILTAVLLASVAHAPAPRAS